MGTKAPLFATAITAPRMSCRRRTTTRLVCFGATRISCEYLRMGPELETSHSCTSAVVGPGFATERTQRFRVPIVPDGITQALAGTPPVVASSSPHAPKERRAVATPLRDV